MAQAVSCKTCDSGTMYLRKRYRMSGPVVVIGYIILIPSVLGIALSAIGLLGSGGAASITFETMKDNTRTTLSEKGIPNSIINKIIAFESVSPVELEALTYEQKQEVGVARLLLTSGTAGAGLGGLAAGGSFLCVGISSFVGGLLGWLLIMKKKILQCSSCKVVVPAS